MPGTEDLFQTMLNAVFWSSLSAIRGNKRKINELICTLFYSGLASILIVARGQWDVPCLVYTWENTNGRDKWDIFC